MKFRLALAKYRQKKHLVQKFARTYKYIVRLLRKRGFDIGDPVYSQQECYIGKKGIFVCAEQIGPGIVGTLYCCANCKGFSEVSVAINKDRKIPKNALIQCIFKREPTLGVLQPIILYPILKKPTNKPFRCEIPAISTIITNYVLGGKKVRGPKTS